MEIFDPFWVTIGIFMWSLETRDALIKYFSNITLSVKTLVNGFQTSGYKTLKWDATNEHGQSVSAGIYVYSIQTESFNQTKKMLLLK